jgi:DNA-binding NtrC family response regulator
MATTETPSPSVYPRTAAGALVASPDPYFREQMLSTLRASHWVVDEAIGGAEALARLETSDCRVLLLDQDLPDLDVTEVVEIVRERYPWILVQVVDRAGAAPRRTHDPQSPSQAVIAQALVSVLRSGAAAATRLSQPPLSPDSECPPQSEAPLDDMIGSSPAMRSVYRMARLVAPRLTTVLVLGGTGTGKELVARAVHRLSPRSRQTLVTVNCAAIPEELLEAELFGYARGAFTGAFHTKMGRLHRAHGGTLFLDEVGDLPFSTQAKLLRFLQDGEVQRLGSSEVLRVDVRVVAATNVSLAERVQQKSFRKDLYYRLSVFPIEIQPLQGRIEDILPLSAYFLTRFCHEGKVPAKSVSRAAEALLVGHSWPGNVRELQNVIERAFILAGNCPKLLPEHISLCTSYPSV